MPKVLIFVAVLTSLLSTSQSSFSEEQQESSMPTLSFSSTVIYVEDNAKQVMDFYQAAFGFAIKYYDDNLDFGELETGNTSIMISSYKGGQVMLGDAFPLSANKQSGGATSHIEIAFLTEDVASAYDKAIAAGAKSAKAPITHPWGQTAAYVYGIEGTLIGILSPVPAASQ